jgi:pimeloyl-ACP methyl ester carboxylesterase
MHYAEAGSGEPLVLLHGWPQHWYVWRHQIPILARKYRVICPDMGGAGWTGAPSNGYEKEQLAADAIALMNALGVERFRLMGHDWGGMVGFLLCLHHPQRIISYLALNIVHPFQRLDARIFTLWRFWYQVVLAIPWLGYWLTRGQAFIRLLIRLNTYQKQWSDEELRTYTSLYTDPARAKSAVLMYRTSLMREQLPMVLGRYRAYRLSTRTLICFGVRDVAMSTALLRGYESHADNMTVELVENSGHFIAEEQPELISSRALAFFDADDGVQATQPALPADGPRAERSDRR